MSVIGDYANYNTCPEGFTADEVAVIISGREDDFLEWSRRRHLPVCDGLAFNPALRVHTDSGCGPHGRVVPRDEMREFLEGEAEASNVA